MVAAPGGSGPRRGGVALSTARPLPQEHVYDARARLSLVAALTELWAFREVLWAFAARTLRLRFKQTLLGVAWVVVQPALYLVVFTLVFGRAAGIDGGGTGYAAFAVSAVVGWNVIAQAVQLGTGALVADAGLMRKVYFPREAAVLGSAGSYATDLVIGSLLILVLAPFTHAELGWSLALAPVLFVAVMLPAIAVTLPLAALAVYHRDVRFVIPFGVQLWLFASPVAYPVTVISERWRDLYALANPAVGPLEGFRRVFALGQAPDWRLLGLSTASGLVLLLVGYRFFKGMERQFADVV